MWLPILVLLCLVAFSYAHSETKEVGFVTGWLTFFKENPVVAGIGAALVYVAWEMFNVMMRAHGRHRVVPLTEQQVQAFVTIGKRPIQTSAGIQFVHTPSVARFISKGGGGAAGEYLRSLIEVKGRSSANRA